MFYLLAQFLNIKERGSLSTSHIKNLHIHDLIWPVILFHYLATYLVDFVLGFRIEMWPKGNVLIRL
jgi:hypothetical protein